MELSSEHAVLGSPPIMIKRLMTLATDTEYLCLGAAKTKPAHHAQPKCLA